MTKSKGGAVDFWKMGANMYYVWRRLSYFVESRRRGGKGKGERAGVCMGRGKHFRWANAVLLGCVLRLCMPFCAGERGGGRFPFPTQGKTTAYGVK